jgi:putative solute:sodium symporter small subunit
MTVSENNLSSKQSDRSGQQRELLIQTDANGNQISYWQANLRLLAKLLSIWFVVSFGFGILFVDNLNQLSFFGFKLGFWWAQQGSIYVFVILIFYYSFKMKQIDRKYGVDDDKPQR